MAGEEVVAGDGGGRISGQSRQRDIPFPTKVPPPVLMTLQPGFSEGEDGLREDRGKVKQTHYHINCTVHVPKQDDRNILQDVLYTISLLKQATFSN